MKLPINLLLVGATAALCSSCDADVSVSTETSTSSSSSSTTTNVNTDSSNTSFSVKSKSWGEVEGQSVQLFTLKNSSGAVAELSDYGAMVVSLMVPDKSGEMGDVALGFDSVNEYVEKSPYFGCIAGRYGNRIAEGKFSLDGKDYTLAVNNDPNHLHGGEKGFDKQVWNADSGTSADGAFVKFSRVSPDGEEGYPGNLSIEVIYTWTDANALRIDYSATTDAPTALNPTNHTYFNLTNEGAPTILDHEMQIMAGRYNPIDAGSIPTGISTVEGTPFDFRVATAIGERIEAEDEQLKNGIGYDHNFVIKDSRDGKLQKVAEVYSPVSGRTLSVESDEPGLQFYSGNFLDGLDGKNGHTYPHRSGFCLEAQTFPDSPNQSEFPSPILRPGETYTQTTIYTFGVR